MILYAIETTKTANITTDSINVFDPVSNIVDPWLTKLYRTASGVKAVNILFDTTTTATVQAFLIANHNLTSSASITLQGNATNVWTSPTVSESITWDADIIKATFTGGTLRYWRIVLSDPANTADYLQIGRAWLGEYYTTAGNHVTVPHDRKSASVKTISVSGQSSMDRRYQYSIVSTKWPILTSVQNNEILSIFDSLDVGTQFFVTFDRAGSILGTMYVTIDEDGLKSTPLGNRNFYKMGMDFRQEV